MTSVDDRRVSPGVRIAGVLLVLGASGCCDDFTKVEQGARGEKSASRVVWTARVGDAMHVGNVRVSPTSTDEVVVAATLQGDVKVGKVNLPAARRPGDDVKAIAADDVAVWKLRPNGKPIWAYRFGDANAQQVSGVSVTGAGTIFIGGRFEGSMLWGNHPWKVGEGVHGGFVAALDPSGLPGWGTWFDADPVPLKNAGQPPAFGASVTSVGTDAMGRLFVMGEYLGRFRINGKQPIVDAPERIGGTFFARFDGAGALGWYRLASYSDSSNDLRAIGKAMCSTEHGNVVLVGTATGEGTFVGVPMKAHPTGSMFVSVWTQTGNHLWDYLLPMSGELASPRVAVAADGSIYVAGITRGKVTLEGTTVEGESAKGTPIPSHAGALFVARFGPNGKSSWLKRLALVRWEDPIGLAADGNEGFVVSATTTIADGLTDVGGGPLFEKALPEMEGVVFAAGYGGDGSHRWSRGFTTKAQNRSGDIVVSGSGRTLLTGLLNIEPCEHSCEQKQLGDVFVAAMRK